MKKLLFLLLGLVCILSNLVAQASLESSKDRLDLKDGRVMMAFSFRDLQTGKRIEPTSFVLSPESEVGVSKGAIQLGLASGLDAVPLIEGTYSATVDAKGYSSMVARVTVLKNGPREQIFNLCPTSPDSRLDEGEIQRHCKSGSTYLNGYVVDRLGNAVAGAAIVCKGGKTESEKDGYFQLEVPCNGKEGQTAGIEVTHPSHAKYIVNGLLVWPNGNWQLKICLPAQGEETQVVDGTPTLLGSSEERMAGTEGQHEEEGGGNPEEVAICLPSTINVGFSSTGAVCCHGGSPACATVQTFPLDDYVKHVLPAEWLASWNTTDAFAAGAIAIRSYSINRINHPVYGGVYDICSSPCCQMYGAGTSTSTSNAVNLTAGYVLQKSNGDVALTEYSAENNHLYPVCSGNTFNQGCSNGQFSWSGNCYSDPVSSGMRMYGHGRGMSQRGSARWSSGRNINSCTNTIQSTNHGYGTKTWQQILALYYPTLSIVNCGTTTGGPPNDNCSQAIGLTSANNCNYTAGTVTGATSSGISIPTCSGYTSGTALDVWYSFTAQASTHEVTVDPDGSGSTAVDPVIGIYSTCSSGGFIDCCDQTGGGGATSTCSFAGLTVGTTYYIRVFDYGSNAPTDGGFGICVTHSGGGGGNQHDFLASNLVLNSTIYAAGDQLDIDVEQCTSVPSAASVSVNLEYTVRTTSGVLIQQLGTDASGLGGGDACDNESISTSFPSGVPAGQCQICAEANYDLAEPESNTSNNRICETVTVPGGNGYIVNVSASPSNGGVVSGGGPYNLGDNVTVTATANPNWNFVDWTENGATVSTNLSFSFTVSGNRDLVANFVSVQSNCNLQLNPSPTNGGTVSGGGQYACGSTVTVSASANSGWAFQEWRENGTAVSSSATYSLTLSTSMTLEAVFVLGSNTFTITAVANPTNGGTVLGAGNYLGGISATLYAIPNGGWQFLNWMENGTIVSTSTPYSFIVNSNRSLVANFVPATGVADLVEEAGFVLFPNPNDGTFALQFPNADRRTVQIYDAVGRRIRDLGEVVSDRAMFELQLVSEGTYFVVVTDRKGNVGTKAMLVKEK